MFLVDFTITTPPKPKFCIPLCDDPISLVLINSEINQFKRNKPALFGAQVAVARSDYQGFLAHDSFIDCSETSALPPCVSTEELKRAIVNGEHWYKGSLTVADVQRVHDVIESSKTIPARRKAAILECLNKVLHGD